MRNRSRERWKEKKWEKGRARGEGTTIKRRGKSQEKEEYQKESAGVGEGGGEGEKHTLARLKGKIRGLPSCPSLVATTQQKGLRGCLAALSNTGSSLFSAKKSFKKKFPFSNDRTTA
jgi:hypothetical protein